MGTGGAHHRAQAVVGGLDGGHPLPQGLVDRIFQGPAAGRDRYHLGPEQLHAEDVEGLALDVDLAHVDPALEAEEGGSGGGGHAVLAGAGLGDHAGLAHPPGEQGLADHVVDLVRPGVSQVLPLEEDADAQPVGQAPALGDRSGPPPVVPQEIHVVGPEHWVGPRFGERGFQLHAGRHQGLREVPPAEVAEAAPGGGVAHQVRRHNRDSARACTVSIPHLRGQNPVTGRPGRRGRGCRRRRRWRGRDPGRPRRPLWRPG